MKTLKQETIGFISKMPEPVDIDEIMYHLYVIDKIRKGREAVDKGNVITIEELKKEIVKW